MEHDSISPSLPTSTLPATRHDGWTGEKMAIFLESLADTAFVAEACEQARMGSSSGPQHPVTANFANIRGLGPPARPLFQRGLER